DPPVMSPTEYAEVFVERVADAVIDAWQRRAPGGVSWGLGHAVVGHNRRASYADGRSQMYGDTSLPDFWGMEGYEDHSLDLLFTWDAADALTGVIVNLACPSQVTENVSYVTADYWHEVRVDLARRLGDSVFVMSQCSAAGDQSPHLLVDKAAEKRMLELRGLTEREEIARRVGLSVEDVVELAACDIRRDPVLEHSLRKVNLPIRRVTDEEYETSRTTIEELEAENPDPKDSLASSRHFIMLRRNRTVVARYESQDAEPWREVELHCVRLGDIAFATSPFEYFLDYGLRIAARSRAVQTFVVQLASGGPDNDGTYLPTERAVAARSYGAEAVDSSVGPDGGQVIVEETLEALDAMWDD
ncbi:MAG TPA: hypothetical protein QGH10_21590, partial [Armatimonadota bacterium]|nr:hypothetical protein [Armatimonadota bacterium]